MMASGFQNEMEKTPAYIEALLRLRLSAAAGGTRIEDVDYVPCEDGKTVMLYGESKDGRCFTSSFEGTP